MLLNFQLSLIALRTTLKVNWYYLCGKLQFPFCIIPKLNYILRIDINKLIENQQVYLLRRVDLLCNDIFDRYGHLKDKAIDQIIDHKRIPNLSLNLLGGKFKPKHCKFQTLREGNNAWNGIERIDLTQYLSNYRIVKDFCFIFFDANDLHNQEIPYKQTFTKDLKNAIDKFYAEVDKPDLINNQYSLKGYTELEHSPTNLNYWHVEFILSDYQHNPIKHSSSTYINEFCKHVLVNIFCKNVKSKIESIPVITKNFYKSNLIA